MLRHSYFIEFLTREIKDYFAIILCFFHFLFIIFEVIKKIFLITCVLLLGMDLSEFKFPFHSFRDSTVKGVVCEIEAKSFVCHALLRAVADARLLLCQWMEALGQLPSATLRGRLGWRLKGALVLRLCFKFQRTSLSINFGIRRVSCLILVWAQSLSLAKVIQLLFWRVLPITWSLGIDAFDVATYNLLLRHYFISLLFHFVEII